MLEKVLPVQGTFPPQKLHRVHQSLDFQSLSVPALGVVLDQVASGGKIRALLHENGDMIGNHEKKEGEEVQEEEEVVVVVGGEEETGLDAEAEVVVVVRMCRAGRAGKDSVGGDELGQEEAP